MENRPIYANKVNVTINEREGCLTFSWIMPKVDESTKTVEEDIVDSIRITMSASGIEALADSIKTLFDQQRQNDGSEKN